MAIIKASGLNFNNGISVSDSYNWNNQVGYMKFRSGPKPNIEVDKLAMGT